MLLCSIDNKTRRLTFIFPPFSRSVDAPQVTASDRRSHLANKMSEHTGLIETKEIGDQYIERADQSLNFEEGVALALMFFFIISRNTNADRASKMKDLSILMINV